MSSLWLLVCLINADGVLSAPTPQIAVAAQDTQAQTLLNTVVQQEIAVRRQRVGISRQDSRLSVKSLIESIEKSQQQVSVSFYSWSSHLVKFLFVCLFTIAGQKQWTEFAMQQHIEPQFVGQRCADAVAAKRPKSSDQRMEREQRLTAANEHVASAVVNDDDIIADRKESAARATATGRLKYRQWNDISAKDADLR